MRASSSRLLAATSVAFAVFVTGCASNGSEADSQLQQARAEQDRLRAEAAAAKRELAERENVIASMKAASAHPAAPAAPAGGNSDLFPPNAKAGECYARVIIPATYETKTEQVTASEASERVEVIPAKFGPASERVLVKEASTRLEVIPATYKTVTERVLVKPASTRLETVPATYRTESEKVLVKAAHTEWKRGTGRSIGSGTSFGGASSQFTRFEGKKVVATQVQDTGEVMCLVEVPAEYRTVTRKVLATPASTREVAIPAEYKTVTRTVVDKPASTREITIPAQYKTVTTTKLLSPASSRKTVIPATYKTITKRSKITDDQLEWRPVLCEVNMTPRNIAALQSALKAKGCYPHRVDGVMGQWTIDGSKCYAKPRGLPSGDKYVTIEVIESLGVKLES
tara:strand:+ start:2822 stop:4018 length:1197 start_codon:yes stop_codon:yes gene_type:complete